LDPAGAADAAAGGGAFSEAEPSWPWVVTSQRGESGKACDRSGGACECYACRLVIRECVDFLRSRRVERKLCGYYVSVAGDARAKSLARLGDLKVLSPADESPKEPAVSLVLSHSRVLLPTEGLFDVAPERSRLENQLLDTERELLLLQGQLANEALRARALANVVAGLEEKRAAARQRMEGIKQNLRELGAA